MKHKNGSRIITFFLTAFLLTRSLLAMEIPLEDFPLENYDQSVAVHLNLNHPKADELLLTPSYQEKQRRQFYNYYYSTEANSLSPWSETFVKEVIPASRAMEESLLAEYNNQNKIPSEQHYSENFKIKTVKWWNSLQDNMQLNTLASAAYQSKNRAIAITNTFARSLPDETPDFLHPSLAGQGFPFDNLQDSAIWLGTPLYVLHTTKNKAWSLVLTPDAYISWVKSDAIAFVSEDFIQTWQTAAQKKLLAITKTEASILDLNDQFKSTSYIGAVFPATVSNDLEHHILIPIKNEKNQAQVFEAKINTKEGNLMPLPATRENMARILKELQQRPYGWGGLFFLNDCSQELKSLFTPFGLWLPRNSLHQSKIGESKDLSHFSLDERLQTLKQQGHPLLTLIYIKGHVMLYVGNEQLNNEEIAMTYQNIWGLSPEFKDKRFVIGQSVFLPLLKQYPEQPDATSLAEKSVFKLVYLDQIPEALPTVQQFLILSGFTKSI